MYEVLSKDMIELEMIPYLPMAKRGLKTRSDLAEVVNCILYRPKTGMQWHLLPVGSLFTGRALHYKTVFGHYRKWCKQGAWKDCWIKLLSRHRSQINLSSGDFDGSHTTAIRGSGQVPYQGRKRRKTTNALHLADRQGLSLAMSEPVAGNHNGLFEIKVRFEVVTATLEDAHIPVGGLSMNANAGSGSKEFRSACAEKDINANICFNKRSGSVDDRDEYFDQELYDERYAVERTNAWTDSFSSLLNRFDTTIDSWKVLNYLAFLVIALKKFTKKKNKKV